MGPSGARISLTGARQISRTRIHTGLRAMHPSLMGQYVESTMYGELHRLKASSVFVGCGTTGLTHAPIQGVGRRRSTPQHLRELLVASLR